MSRSSTNARYAAVAAVVAALLASTAASAALIRGGSGNDTLNGTDAADQLYGRGGNDTLNGGGGHDDLDGGPGADVLNGGRGIDAATYGGRTNPVTVTLDGQANDGEAGEGDNVRDDVEAVYGGRGPDRIAGNGRENTIYGAEGDDIIDVADGRPGDYVDCGPGNDTVRLDKGDDTVDCERRRVVQPKRATGLVRSGWLSFSTHSVATLLQVVEITPTAARVEVRCSGRGCPFKSRRYSPKGGRVNLIGDFRGKQLRVGVRLEVRIVAPGRVGKVAIYSVRGPANGRPRIPSLKISCVEADGTKVVRCP